MPAHTSHRNDAHRESNPHPPTNIQPYTPTPHLILAPHPRPRFYLYARTRLRYNVFIHPPPSDLNLFLFSTSESEFIHFLLIPYSSLPFLFNGPLYARPYHKNLSQSNQTLPKQEMVMMMTMDYMEPKQDTSTTTRTQRSHEEYMLALEEERRKIQVFHRELPLCLDLVNQAIENCKQHVYNGKRSECGEVSERPVLEEFIPLKRSSCSDEDEPRNLNDKIENDKKVDWLKSVQLWNQTPDSQENSPKIKENGGAFHPFHETKPVRPVPTRTETVTTTTTSPVPATSSSSTADDNIHKRREEKDAQSNRKARRCWSPELHRRFLQALQQLGGSHAATPKQIRELMKVDGLTNDEVKSHLQKYRLHTRRPGPSMHNGGNSQQTQFVVVGGIWVPPQDYSPATTSKGDTTSTVSDRVYVPVASVPQLSLSSQQMQQQEQQRKQLQLSTGSSPSEQKSSGGAEHSMGDDNRRSSSPAATSSSTETTTASPKFD